jgi:hypothetical protein
MKLCLAPEQEIFADTTRKLLAGHLPVAALRGDKGIAYWDVPKRSGRPPLTGANDRPRATPQAPCYSIMSK